MTLPVHKDPALKKHSPWPSLTRVNGILLRHVYLYIGSWPRLVEMMYWPVINLTLFGFISLSIIHRFGHADVMTDCYLAGLMLAEILTRNVMGTMVIYMEEVWSRNLGHLFASPLRLRDYITAMMALSAVRCTIAVIPAFVIVYFLFDFSILRMGWYLPLYAALLCFNGWWYGMMIISLLLRFGLAAEWMGWMCTWLLLPFMAPYYAVSILPAAFQVISWSLPGTYVFESMKAQLTVGTPRLDYLGIALVLNILYFGLATVVFLRSYAHARDSGGLLQMGE